MNPKHFALLAGAALASIVLAIATYSASQPWTAAVPGNAKLFSGLSGEAGKISGIEVTQGASTVRLERKGEAWTLKERSGFPANTEKVRALLIAVTVAELVEAKTRKPDRYGVLEVEEPIDKGANSRLLKLIDEKGAAIADVIVGKKRLDAFGSGKAGTYIRKPGDAQSWLVNAPIDAPVRVKDWIKSRVFETQADKIRRIVLEMPGEQPIEIEWDATKKRPQLKDIPAGKKVKYANSIDDIQEALSAFDIEDVRKMPDTPSGDNVSTARVEIEGGLKVAFKIRKSADGDWLSLAATGEGDTAKFAEALTSGAAGWEFKLPKAKAGDVLKTRADLLEVPAVTEPGPGAAVGPAAPNPGEPKPGSP